MPLLSEQGFSTLQVSVLQPLDPFLQLSGEDVRRRLFVTVDPSGREYCLRPDFTIPVAMEHLSSGAADKHVRYAYEGPIFRFRPHENVQTEQNQAGAEWFGEQNSARADADMLSLAIECLEKSGAVGWQVRTGNVSIWNAVLGALDLTADWRRRIWRELGREGGLTALLDAQNASQASKDARAPALAEILGNADQGVAAAAIDEILALSGLEKVSARSSEEIAQRFLEKAEQARTAGIADDVKRALLAFHEISGAPADALDALRATARAFDLEAGIGAEIDALASFFDKLQESTGQGSASISFDMGFVRPFDYYTGLVFDIVGDDGSTKSRLCAGGRYNKLLSYLSNGQAPDDIPAVGFSLWLDRIEKARGED